MLVDYRKLWVPQFVAVALGTVFSVNAALAHCASDAAMGSSASCENPTPATSAAAASSTAAPRSTTRLASGAPAVLAATASPKSTARAATPDTATVTLSEWKVEVEPSELKPGPIVFKVRNAGKVSHALEVEGKGIEKQIATLPHDASGELRLTLAPGKYEAYCPVGRGSHKMLGMVTSFSVKGAAGKVAKVERDADDDHDKREAGEHDMSKMGAMHDDDDDDDAVAAPAKALRVIGGGDVVQILPGPFPFADSAAAVITSRPDDQRTDLTAKAKMGPYSNNVTRTSGTLDVNAIDRGASGDSVSGVAEFVGQGGTRWRVVMDRVQTKDIPDNPRFGGVIMGLYYHGASGVHTPLVPTIQSTVALWAYAHVYENDKLVTDDALVHIMYLSRTRRPGDFALECWDCSRNPVEEVQLQVTAPKGQPGFDSPGGFLFVNWEKSRAETLAAR
jgi:hypothetical protein